MGGSLETAVLDDGVASAQFGIPPLDLQTGHLPPGRYRTTLFNIRERFVESAEFQDSSTREHIWAGFTDYLVAWKQSQVRLGQSILKTIWIGGSFVSSELNPADIDISPIYDHSIVEELTETPGIGGLKKLIGNRTSLTKKYMVEPFPMPWRSLESTLHPSVLPEHAQTYLAKRGGLDDWWQRIRPAGEKVAPVPPDEDAARGYLEVSW